MTPEELTQLAAIQQTMLARHEQEMAEIRATLNRVVEQQAVNSRQIEANNRKIEAIDRQIEASNRRTGEIDRQIEAGNQRTEAIDRQIEATDRQIALNRQDIAVLTASIQELRNLVADYCGDALKSPPNN